MSRLEFSNIRKVFPGDVVAVEDFTLAVDGSRMVVIVGPSGCGKTTLLRMIAGLETPTSGSIHLAGKRIDTLAPRKRDIAMVFQSYALYPHMTVAGNLSFALRLRKLPRTEVERRITEVARTLEIEKLLHRKPGELSGGQRQRVALGRAVVREPRAFLFDEPLSNLDARLRADMRALIKQLHARLGVTSVYVTHDQVEAMTIGDVLVVMSEGRIRQVGAPRDCYDMPADTFVASFIGSPAMNLVDARVDLGERCLVADGVSFRVGDDTLTRIERAGVGRVVVGIRPEHVTPGGADGAGLHGSARVVLREPLGHETITHMEAGPARIVARGRDMFDEAAETVSLHVADQHLHLFNGDSGVRLGRGER